MTRLNNRLTGHHTAMTIPTLRAAKRFPASAISTLSSVKPRARLHQGEVLLVMPGPLFAANSMSFILTIGSGEVLIGFETLSPARTAITIPTPRVAMAAMPQAAMRLLSNQAVWTSVLQILNCRSAPRPRVRPLRPLRVVNSMLFNKTSGAVLTMFSSPDCDKDPEAPGCGLDLCDVYPELCGPSDSK